MPSAPLALILTTRIEPKRLFLGALGLFIACSLAAAASPNFTMMLVARVGMAMASATACLLATMLATELVDEKIRGRAIGIIFMGISGSLVFGVPAGIVISHIAGWRGVFVALSLLAVAVGLVSWRCVPVSGLRKTALPKYLTHLRVVPLAAGQLVSILMIGGHFVLFAFLAPHLVEVAGVAEGNVVLAFGALGIRARSQRAQLE